MLRTAVAIAVASTPRLQERANTPRKPLRFSVLTAIGWSPQPNRTTGTPVSWPLTTQNPKCSRRNQQSSNQFSCEACRAADTHGRGEVAVSGVAPLGPSSLVPPCRHATNSIPAGRIPVAVARTSTARGSPPFFQASSTRGQGSPNRWEPIRFDRSSPVPVWTGTKPAQIQKNEKFSKNS